MVHTVVGPHGLLERRPIVGFDPEVRDERFPDGDELSQLDGDVPAVLEDGAYRERIARDRRLRDDDVHRFLRRESVACWLGVGADAGRWSRVGRRILTPVS